VRFKTVSAVTHYKIIEREYKVRRETKNKKVQKITQKLYTNGFTSDIIRKVFDIFFEDYEDENEDEIFKASILIGEASEETFKNMLDEHSSENEIVITSDREAIHKICIEGHIKLLIITSGFVLKKELREQAAANGVSVCRNGYEQRCDRSAQAQQTYGRRRELGGASRG